MDRLFICPRLNINNIQLLKVLLVYIEVSWHKREQKQGLVAGTEPGCGRKVLLWVQSLVVRTESGCGAEFCSENRICLYVETES
jgi:hypothetical protein